jgi:hypothetical protein
MPELMRMNPAFHVDIPCTLADVDGRVMSTKRCQGQRAVNSYPSHAPSNTIVCRGRSLPSVTFSISAKVESMIRSSGHPTL